MYNYTEKIVTIIPDRDNRLNTSFGMSDWAWEISPGIGLMIDLDQTKKSNPGIYANFKLGYLLSEKFNNMNLNNFTNDFSKTKLNGFFIYWAFNFDIN